MSHETYGTQSALTDFREYTIVKPGRLAKYVGFTEDEVRALCDEHDMDFAEMKRWYDGYKVGGICSVYIPNLEISDSFQLAVQNEGWDKVADARHSSN